MVYTYNGILLDLKKQGNPDLSDNMGEPRRHYAKWNKSLIERETMHDSIYIKFIEAEYNDGCQQPSSLLGGREKMQSCSSVGIEFQLFN